SRSRQRAAARRRRPRAPARRGQHISRSATEQSRGAGALYALRLPEGRHAARLLSRALRPRGRAGPDPAAGVTRRHEILREMGLRPVGRLGAQRVQEEKGGWIELKQAVPACTACGLHKTRTQTVFGVGDEQADWMFVGEAPGAEEDRLG